IQRYGRAMHVSLPAYERAEQLFNRHGAISIFVSRLLPGVRHLISIPAGLARMPLGAFMLLTLLGAGLWNSVLAYLGYWFGQQPQQLAQAMRTYSHAIVAGCLLLVALYAGVLWLRHARSAAES
ncbi:MAG TPA: DedA family protein, partial [bacterium]|nr:DedA family protein [bacterium]